MIMASSDIIAWFGYRGKLTTLVIGLPIHGYDISRDFAYTKTIDLFIVWQTAYLRGIRRSLKNYYMSIL